MILTPAIRGCGTASNPHNRFAPQRSVSEDDGWYQEVPLTQGTEVIHETAKSIITRNTSPDIPFDRSINPYRGCEHGCLYCAIRHQYGFCGGLGLALTLQRTENEAQRYQAENAVKLCGLKGQIDCRRC